MIRPSSQRSYFVIQDVAVVDHAWSANKTITINAALKLEDQLAPGNALLMNGHRVKSIMEMDPTIKKLNASSQSLSIYLLELFTASISWSQL